MMMSISGELEITMFPNGKMRDTILEMRTGDWVRGDDVSINGGNRKKKRS